MGELRFDLSTADWVVFAPSRIRRPHEFVAETAAERAADSRDHARCPFCPGNESLTPAEIFALRPSGAGTSEWQVRVIPNKFPALRIEEDPHRVRIGDSFESMGGCGAHEVIIESPDHETHLSQQPLDQIERVLRTAQLRFGDLLRDRRFQAVVVFKNHGEAAGTSLRHPHWQVIATPVVPRLLRLKHAEATAYFDRTGECLYCVLAAREREDEVRLVAENDAFVAFVPYAAHLPFETWIMPRRHQSSFGSVDPQDLRPLADLLRSVLYKMRIGLEDPSFNLTIDTAPRGDEQKEYFLWHMRILPRLATAAGFELGSGMSINTVLPEEAAAFLRDVETEQAAAPA